MKCWNKFVLILDHTGLDAGVKPVINLKVVYCNLYFEYDFILKYNTFCFVM